MSEHNCFDCIFMRPAPDGRYDCGFVRGPGYETAPQALAVGTWLSSLPGDDTPTAEEVAAGSNCPGWALAGGAS